MKRLLPMLVTAIDVETAEMRDRRHRRFQRALLRWWEEFRGGVVRRSQRCRSFSIVDVLDEAVLSQLGPNEPFPVRGEVHRIGPHIRVGSLFAGPSPGLAQQRVASLPGRTVSSTTTPM